MLPEAKSEELIYAAGGCGGVCVLAYPGGKLVGHAKISGFVGGACSDSNGNVFISADTQVLEYAHGKTSPVASLSLPGDEASGCSIDPETGNLAVVFGGSGADVAIFSDAQGTPSLYETRMTSYSCGYDNSGNLFVSGYNGQNAGLSELPKGSVAFQTLSVDPSVGEPGQVQWDGQYMSYEDLEGGLNNKKIGIISRLSISGSSATIVAQIRLKRVPNRLTQSWISDGSIIAPYSVTGPNPGNIGVWKYPRGGDPISRIKKFGKHQKDTLNFTGVTLSVAPSGSHIRR
jgi:hypothetical protein